MGNDSAMYDLARVTVRYPMLDDRLIYMATRMLADNKIPYGRPRDFYKGAMRRVLLT